MQGVLKRGGTNQFKYFVNVLWIGAANALLDSPVILKSSFAPDERSIAIRSGLRLLELTGAPNSLQLLQQRAPQR
jgi:hypothetical protein